MQSSDMGIVDVIEHVEDICAEIACGSTLQKALDKRCLNYWDFYRLRQRDEAVDALFREAERCHAAAKADYMHDKVEMGLTVGLPNNSGPALRSLQWLIEKRDPERFGDKARDINLNLDLYKAIADHGRAGADVGTVIEQEPELLEHEDEEE